MTRNYQYNFSKIDDSMFDDSQRVLKAKKTISVLEDFLADTKNLTSVDSPTTSSFVNTKSSLGVILTVDNPLITGTSPFKSNPLPSVSPSISRVSGSSKSYNAPSTPSIADAIPT